MLFAAALKLVFQGPIVLAALLLQFKNTIAAAMRRKTPKHPMIYFHVSPDFWAAEACLLAGCLTTVLDCQLVFCLDWDSDYWCEAGKGVGGVPWVFGTSWNDPLLLVFGTETIGPKGFPPLAGTAARLLDAWFWTVWMIWGLDEPAKKKSENNLLCTFNIILSTDVEQDLLTHLVGC